MLKIVIGVIRWIYWVPVRSMLARCSPVYLFQIQKIIGFFVYRIFRGRKKYMVDELKRSFGGEWPQERIKKAVRAAFDVYVGTQLRMLGLSRMGSSNIDEYVSVEGLQYLNAELGRRKGVIILNSHFGPFMLIMPALGYRGYKARQIALQGEPPWGPRKGFDKKIYEIKFKSIEGNMPVKFINAALGAFSLREAIKALDNNEIVLYPSTGRGGTAFHAITLMERKALLPLAPFKMALRTGAALLPAFVICEGRSTIVRFEKGMTIGAGVTPEDLVEKYAKVLDSYIEKYPGHFLMYLYEVHSNTRFGEAPFFIE